MRKSEMDMLERMHKPGADGMGEVFAEIRTRR